MVHMLHVQLRDQSWRQDNTTIINQHGRAWSGLMPTLLTHRLYSVRIALDGIFV